MNPQLAEELDVPASMSGIVIVEVQPGSPASDAGLRPGDIVQEVNRKPVKTVNDFKSAVSNSPDPLLFAISRNGHTVYAAVDRNA
jgi:serine protease Do